MQGGDITDICKTSASTAFVFRALTLLCSVICMLSCRHHVLESSIERTRAKGEAQHETKTQRSEELSMEVLGSYPKFTHQPNSDHLRQQFSKRDGLNIYGTSLRIPSSEQHIGCRIACAR